MGRDIRGSSIRDQLAFADWELRNTESAAGRALRRQQTPYDAGAVVSRLYERPADKFREAALRGNTAEQIAKLPEIPVKVEVTLRGDGKARATATAGRGNSPAISHAWQN
jgi:hypothetical protein